MHPNSLLPMFGKQLSDWCVLVCIGRLVAWSVGWSVGWLVGWLSLSFIHFQISQQAPPGPSHTRLQSIQLPTVASGHFPHSGFDTPIFAIVQQQPKRHSKQRVVGEWWCAMKGRSKTMGASGLNTCASAKSQKLLPIRIKANDMLPATHRWPAAPTALS
jgi:hypothetical protein